MGETQTRSSDVDVVVVGAGMAGIYLLKRLRDLGFSTRVFEAGHDVGGTWYWNRYPGARCDIESLDYSYTWDPELADEWQWSEKFAPQPEILRYLQYVTQKHDLRDGMEFETRVTNAVWDDTAARWRLTTSHGEEVACRHYVMATGCLSAPKEVDIDGTDKYRGPVYFTSRWPHEGVDFTGQRVAVIGTGSSAIQSIPIIASQAAQLTVFQRTPNYSIPAWNGPVPEDKRATINADRVAYRDAARLSGGGVPVVISTTSALSVSDEERNATLDEAWKRGGIMEFLNCFSDILRDQAANELAAEFVRNQIRSTVHDPVTAEALCPKDYPLGTKRLCVDTNYYATYNEPHVRLVNLRDTPITSITETGVDTTGESMEFDAIVFATGFDAMTGAMVAVDIAGRDGVTLKQAWADGPRTYLGLMAHGFPNLYMITGPGSPSVLSNMVVSIEQHVDWVVDCVADLRADDFAVIEPTTTAVDGWVDHVNQFAEITLMHQANSWYLGANVPGKPRVILPYVGGVGRYRVICDSVVAQNYLGFERRSGDGNVVALNDGVICRLQPDVGVMLEILATLGLPAMDSMSAADARMFSSMSASQRPSGPDVGEIVDGVLPGAAGDLNYRLYRPDSPGPHPVVVYYHGGGWVLGSHDSDDPFCRDLCKRSDTIIISVDYGHAPEARFPAAVDDAVAALQWVAANVVALGGREGELAVAGWSAGANLATVVSRLSLEAGGPTLKGQLLLTPATDAAMDTTSYRDNGDGYILTAALMNWFYDHYAPNASDRCDPRCSPLRAESLAGLAPAMVVTGEFDPLRDEGNAYAAALSAAGVPVEHVVAAGHIHTSITAVDALPTGAPIRARMAEALAAFFVA